MPTFTSPVNGASFAADPNYPPVGTDLVGTGTPEGAKTAPVGSIFRRKDGGALTSFYVKETGVGNTGWVGK